MAKTTSQKQYRKPVFFVATKTRKQPVRVNFYTKQGRPVSFESVKKVKTKEGVRFFAQPNRMQKR